MEGGEKLVPGVQKGENLRFVRAERHVFLVL